MVRIFRHYVPIPILILGLVELVILNLSIHVGIYARYMLATDFADNLMLYFHETLTFTLVLGVSMFALGLYQREFVRDFKVVYIRLVTSFSAAFLILSLVFYVIPELKIWRSALAIGIVVAIAAILATRVVFLRVANLSRFKRRVLVMGTGARAARIAAVERDRNRGFMVVGFVAANDGVCLVAPERVLTSVKSIAAFARREGVEEIIIAIEDCRGNMPIESLLECKLDGVKVTECASFLECETGRVDVGSLNPSWMIFSDGFECGRAHLVAKRLVDIAASLAVLVFTLPLLLVTAIAIRAESRGPILFRQSRVGRGGRAFTLYKFRSMRADAEDDGVPRWSSRNDDRVTWVGAIIRKTRIDEIPQVINVLGGDMSFVGPRPERPYFVERLARDIPYYVERHRVCPGITGWAQINYPYGASIDDAKRKLEYDFYYLKNMSPLLDMIIIAQTLRVVLWSDSTAPRTQAVTVEGERTRRHGSVA